MAAALVEATAALNSRPSRLSRTGVVWCHLIPHPYIETPLWLGPVDNSWFSIGWKHTTSYPLAFHLFSNPEGNQRVLSLLIYLSIVTLLDFNVILCQMLLKLLISIKSLTANCKSGRSWFCEFSIFVLIVSNSFVLGCFGSRCGNIGRHLREWIFLPPLAKGTFALYFPRGSQSFSGSNPFPETQLFLTN